MVVEVAGRLPLDAAWREGLDAIAAARNLPRSADIGRLAPALREVSDFYNAGEFRFAWTPERMAARLHFFLPRDQAKVAGALRDVALSPEWKGEGDPLELLDVGAGLGASSLGAVLALRSAGVTRELRVSLADPDASALSLAADVLATLPNVRVRRHDGAALHPDLVIFAQVLVEMAAGLPESAGDEACAKRVADAARGLAPGGRVVVVEPALLTSTRRLMRVRDRLAASGAHIVAPCPHSAGCAMLAQPRDWCHDDLNLDLPPWLHPLARAAGLRWQGLTFARLVLAAEAVPRPPLRVVAPPRDSRGRKERQLCGEFTDGSRLRWVDRLDKHASPGNAPFAELRRGDALTLDPPSARVGPETLVIPTVPYR